MGLTTPSRVCASLDIRSQYPQQPFHLSRESLMLRMRILASLFLILAVPAMAGVPTKVPAKAYDRPLTFEANHGQFVHGVLYAARGPEYSVVIDRAGASLHLDEATLRLQVIGPRA